MAKHEKFDRDERRQLELIQGLLEMASANFPSRCRDVRIETCGTNPHASITLPYFILSRALRLALETDAAHAR